MTKNQLLLVIGTVFALSLGQVLFKYAAESINASSKGLLYGVLLNPWLMAALCVYAGATLAWLWVLRVLPLHTAYPFVALAFIIVPILAHFLLGESVKWTTFASASLIFLGVWVSTL
jgi:undecaprenyl phosphate-alpha-L-ara4N flippase subunit ArnE